MATIKEFHALRPTQALVSKIAALPYDVYSVAEAREAVKGNEYSFLRVDKPEITMDENINPYDDAVYQRAKENLQWLIDTAALQQDEQACLYIYRLAVGGRQQTGLVALTSVDEYLNGTIKKHELTREDKEQDRIKHVNATNAHTGPIFMAYRATTAIREMMNRETEREPVYHFTSDDGVTHTAWVINNKDSIAAFKDAFAAVPNLYIADGHHRNASAAKVAQMRRQQGNFTGNEAYNDYLSVLFPDDALTIYDYNRVVKDILHMTTGEFLEKVSRFFHVDKLAYNDVYAPEKQHTFGLYIDGAWIRLTARDEIVNQSNAVDALDVSILQTTILTEILDIRDPRTDKRIDFVGGIRGLQELCKLVDCGQYRFAIAMYPTSMSELLAVADSGEMMPPKSTWFEPKLRSGIFIHTLA